MGFSSALQGRAAHEALIVRQDAELRLMETMKRSIQMKAKCDKEYAINLAAVAQQGLKIDRIDELQDSLITKSWRTYMDELDHQAKQFKSNAELLEVVCEKIAHLSQDKRKARKAYQEEHAKIAARLNHLTDEVLRKKTEYQKHLEGYKTLRTRFEEHYVKSGRSGRKLDDVRDKYQKACRKLHLTHNEYVLTIVEAVEVEKDFRTILLPGLLEHQQSVQESFILLWKNILQEAIQHSDLTSDKFKEIQKRIELAINNINPCEEYREFTEKHKTSPASPVVFQFDESLIEDIPGKLQSNTLTVDNLTVDWLRSRLNELDTSVKECQEKQEKLVCDLNGGTPLTNGINGIGKDTQKQSKDLNSLRCQEKQKQKLADMIKIALSEVGCEELPSGCDDHLTNVEQNFIENNGFSNEQPGNSIIPANSVSIMLQRGAEMISVIKSPFKRRTTPQSPIAKSKNRTRCPSEDGKRSQSTGSLSVNSSNNNSSLSVITDHVNHPDELNSEISSDNKCLNVLNFNENNKRTDETNNNSQATNIYAELDLAFLESKKQSDKNDTNESINNTAMEKLSTNSCLQIENLSSAASEDGKIHLVKIENLPSKSESFLFRNKISTLVKCEEAIMKNSIDAHLDKIDEINKSMDDKLKQTLPIDNVNLDKCLNVLKKNDDEILQCNDDDDNDVDENNDNGNVPSAQVVQMNQNTATNKNDNNNSSNMKISENVTDFELQQLIQKNFIKPTPKQILQEQKEVEKLAKKIRKKAEEKSKKQHQQQQQQRSSSFSHKSINNLITNLKEFGFSSTKQTTNTINSQTTSDNNLEERINENPNNDDDVNENNKTERKKLKYSSSERIAMAFSNIIDRKEFRKNSTKDNKRSFRNTTPTKKSPKSPRNRKTKNMRNTFRTKLFHFQSKKSSKICKKCSKKKQTKNENEQQNPDSFSSSIEIDIDEQQQQRQNQQNQINNEFCVCDINSIEIDSSNSNDDPLCIKEHTYCEPFGMSFSPNRPLYEEEWFHGVLPREEVVRLLKIDGDFLVRETMRNEESQIVLSVCWNGHKHFIVQTTAEGHYRFEGPPFPSIQELIMHQYQSELPVTVKSGAILRRPVMRERWELSNDDVILLEKIGRGNFGDVYKAKLKSTKLDVAVKTCRMTLPEEQKRKFLQEGRILKQYDHPNIVKLIGICVQKQPIMIVMELVPGGSLLNYLRKNSNTLNTRQLTAMCKDAAAGMRYLESKNCIHRDLAARNCLIDYENSVKISDFGMSREEEEYIVSDGMKQIPVKWTAPEALNFGKYTSLCDVWSYGILMWEIFSKGDTPYSGMSNSRARERIDTGYRMPAPENTPSEIYRLMLKCWAAEPESRPHFDEIYNIVDTILIRQDS